MAFHVIHTAPELSERERRRAHRAGPWAVASRHAPSEMMRRAGFIDVDVVDQTEAFRTTAAAWIRESGRTSRRPRRTARRGGVRHPATRTDRAIASDR